MQKVNILLALLSALSSAVSFGSYLLLFWYFGPHIQLDSLFRASAGPTAIGGIVSAVFLAAIPTTLTGKSSAEQNQFIGETSVKVWAWSCVGMAGLIGAMFYVGFSLTGWMALVYIPTSAMFLMSTLTSALCQARGAFLYSLVPSILTSTGLAAGCVLAVALNNVWWVPLLHLSGAALPVGWRRTVLPAFRKFKLIDSLLRWHRKQKKGLLHALHVLAATLPFTLFQPMDAILSSQMPVGALSILTLSQRILVAYGTIISVGVCTTAAFRSHGLLLDGGEAAVKRDAFRKAIEICGLGLFGAFVFWCIRDSCMNEFARVAGKSATGATELFHVVGIMLLGCGPMAAIPFLVRISYRLNNYIIPAILGGLIPLTYLSLGLWIVGIFGLLGIAWIYVALWWASLLLILVWMHRSSPCTLSSETMP